MKVFEANITNEVSVFLNSYFERITSFELANHEIFNTFGIINFFDSNDELITLKEIISETQIIINEPDRTEYGDFQTNIDLSEKIVLHLIAKKISPEIIIEPTCGKGNFIIASLRNFPKIKNIFGVEIYKPYVWETKFAIIEYYLKNNISPNSKSNRPKISITHCSVFDFDFKQIAREYANNEILVIGNPPWVTNAKLGSLNSTNLPQKSNFKNHSGLDAMTGKGNFDIAEFITLMMLDTFQHTKGYLLFLVKNSVIKNIIFDQQKHKYKIGLIEKHCIDSKKEFNVSVEASLFICELNSIPSFSCKEYNFYDNNEQDFAQAYQKFGWIKDKFVSNIETYSYTKDIDGVCPFIWRQGLKHDCSTIMELEKNNGHFINGLNKEVKLEDDLVYGFLKSSDLKNAVISETRKFTIVTQKKVGQETKYIKSLYPKTYQYLIEHQENFEARKSIIYNNKPPFSIFGIGDYSFKPFKIAISGLYKTFHFTLVLPQNNKPVMLDDTCYLIGFDKIEFAVYTLILLNSNITKQFLQSVTFADAKRTFTKDVLMRIDILKLAKQMDRFKLQNELSRLNENYKIHLTLQLWDEFIDLMIPSHNRQIAMFV